MKDLKFVQARSDSFLVAMTSTRYFRLEFQVSLFVYDFVKQLLTDNKKSP